MKPKSHLCPSRVFGSWLLTAVALVPLYLSFGSCTAGAYKYRAHQGMTSTRQQPEEFNLNGIDGPYLVGSTIYRVDASNNVQAIPYKVGDPILVEVRNEDSDRFHVLKKDKITLNPEIYPMPKKLIAISDIEGNFDAFAGFLMAHRVIDEKFDWIFGDGHLVLVGDFVDRGSNVVPVLWLIYKLEDEARKHGGHVHYILGNHELLNFQGKVKYNDERYIKIATIITGKEDPKEAVRFMYSKETELGRWLHSKNGIEKIGDYLFVHAGLSPKLPDFRLSIPQINEISRQHWDKDLYNHPQSNKAANFLIGEEGIFWFRGLAKDHKGHKKISEDELEDILDYYRAETVIFGHTVVDQVTKDFDGKAINIDVKHGKSKHSEKTQGLLIEDGIEYRLDGTGQRVRF